MATFASWQNINGALKRKALTGIVAQAPMTATPPTAMTGADSTLVAKPTGYNDFGWTSDDGVTVSRSVDKSEITGWQGVAPIRSDVTSDTETLQVAFHETNAYVISAYFGVDLATLIPDTSSGEVAWSKPPTPLPTYMRLLTLAKDSANNLDYYIMRSYPRVSVTDWDDYQFGKTDDGIIYGLTFTAYVDDTLGYSVRTFIGGAGAKALNTSARFPSS